MSASISNPGQRRQQEVPFSVRSCTGLDLHAWQVRSWLETLVPRRDLAQCNAADKRPGAEYATTRGSP